MFRWRKKNNSLKIRIVNKDRAVAVDKDGNEVNLILFTEKELEELEKIKKEITK